MKTSELTGAVLDWAVANAAGMFIEIRPAGSCGRPLYVLAGEPGRIPWVWSPSTSWHHGGPIIERERISTEWSSLWDCWTARDLRSAAFSFTGPTPLIAAMRCYVASKLGDEVDVPEELL